jgi:hypothetical protein
LVLNSFEGVKCVFSCCEHRPDALVLEVLVAVNFG